ncbi:mCG10639, isoform CRA_b [Mus musculus]|nr:mCG10639, isoform CRA_b [Mus musculus]
MDLPYYHGCLTKRECEALLLKGGVDGNFLIRDSESVPGALCLCVSLMLILQERSFQTYRNWSPNMENRVKDWWFTFQTQ